MKKKTLIIIAIALALIVVSVSAASISFDFSKYSDEELISLETALQAEKISRGMAKQATITSGKYTVGVDIPAGTYKVETAKGGADHLYVRNSKGKTIGSYAIGTASDRSPIGKLELTDGDTIEFDSCTLIFTVYSGGITFE